MFSCLILFFLNSVHADISYSLDSYVYFQKYQPRHAFINPGNQVLKLPEQEVSADIRGEFKWKSDLNQIVIRPRLESYARDAKFDTSDGSSDSKTDLDLTDAFVETYLGSDFSLNVGLQVYQWGPAEFLNPSNPLFHFNSRQKSFVYKEKGKALVRANYSLSRDDNFVFMIEPISNNERPWISEDRFVAKALIKYEHQWQNVNQVGVVVGREEKEQSFGGGYFSFEVNEGFSLYGDFKFVENSYNFVPEVGLFFTDLVEPVNSKKWPVLAVVGVRSEGDYDLRGEYIYNQAGFDRHGIKSVLDSILNPFNPNYALNLQRFQSMGLELLGQQYFYLSYRVNEPFENKDLNLYLRYLASLQDYSGQTQLEFDKAVSDSIILFGGLGLSSGNEQAEFRLINDWQATGGFKWAL